MSCDLETGSICHGENVFRRETKLEEQSAAHARDEKRCEVQEEGRAESEWCRAELELEAEVERPQAHNLYYQHPRMARPRSTLRRPPSWYTLSYAFFQTGQLTSTTDVVMPEYRDVGRESAHTPRNGYIEGFSAGGSSKANGSTVAEKKENERERE